MGRDSLGDRMKGYEYVNRTFLTRRTPTIIRLDGRAFHTFTKGFQKPFDGVLIETMQETARYLCENIQGCKVAYTQSDEISLLLTDYEKITTDAWFDKNVQKMASISASMATLSFNKAFDGILSKMFFRSSDATDVQKVMETYNNKRMTAMFDSRVFNLPKEDVCNYFIWRQQDCVRNSVQMVGQSEFSHKQLHGKSCDDIQEMLLQEKQINWNDYPAYQKQGSCTIKEQVKKEIVVKGEAIAVNRSEWIVDKNIPIFTQDRWYIEKYL